MGTILTLASFGVPEGLGGLDRAVVVDAAREEVRCRFGGILGRLVRFKG